MFYKLYLIFISWYNARGINVEIINQLCYNTINLFKLPALGGYEKLYESKIYLKSEKGNVYIERNK